MSHDERLHGERALLRRERLRHVQQQFAVHDAAERVLPDGGDVLGRVVLVHVQYDRDSGLHDHQLLQLHVDVFLLDDERDRQ